MITIIKLCDLCSEDGYQIQATHQYRALDGKVYDICGKCLKIVQTNDQMHARKISGNVLLDATIFVNHVQAHLRPGQYVVCKICDMSIDEIAEEAE